MDRRRCHVAVRPRVRAFVRVPVELHGRVGAQAKGPPGFGAAPVARADLLQEEVLPHDAAWGLMRHVHPAVSRPCERRCREGRAFGGEGIPAPVVVVVEEPVVLGHVRLCYSGVSVRGGLAHRTCSRGEPA